MQRSPERLILLAATTLEDVLSALDDHRWRDAMAGLSAAAVYLAGASSACDELLSTRDCSGGCVRIEVN